MKKLRMLLVILAIIHIASFVLMAVFSQAVQEGTLSDDWVGVFGLIAAMLDTGSRSVGPSPDRSHHQSRRPPGNCQRPDCQRA